MSGTFFRLIFFSLPINSVRMHIYCSYIFFLFQQMRHKKRCCYLNSFLSTLNKCFPLFVSQFKCKLNYIIHDKRVQELSIKFSALSSVVKFWAFKGKKTVQYQCILIKKQMKIRYNNLQLQRVFYLGLSYFVRKVIHVII